MTSMDVHVLHVSDTHLGLRQYGRPEREKDVYDAFEEVVDVAVREHVDIVVHAGDFFDTTRPPMWAIRYAIRGLRRLRDNGIPVVGVLGDHDIPKRRDLPPLYLLEEEGLLRLVGKIEEREPGARCLEVRGRAGQPICIHGLYAHRGVQATLLRERLGKIRGSIGKPSILLLHQTLDIAAPEYDMSLTDLPRGFSYYAMGHIHVRLAHRLGDAMVVYPGSIEVTRLDEIVREPSKYVVIASITAKGTRGVEWVRVKSVREHIVVDAVADELEKTLRALAARIRAAGYQKKPVLHMRIKGSVRSKRSLYQLIERYLGELVLLYRIIHVEDAGGVYTDETPAAQGAVIDHLETLKRILGDKELAELAYNLLVIYSRGAGVAQHAEASRFLKEYFVRRYGVEP